MSRPVIKTGNDQSAKLTAWAFETKEQSKIPVLFKGRLEMGDQNCQVVGFPVKNSNGSNPDISWEVDKQYYKHMEIEAPFVPSMVSWLNHGSISTSLGKDEKMKIKSGFDPLETEAFTHLAGEGKKPMIVCQSEDKDTKIALWPARRQEDNRLFLSGKMTQGEQTMDVSGNFINPTKAGSPTALLNIKNVENQPLSLWINDFGSASIKGGPNDVDLKGGVHPAIIGEVADDLRGIVEAKREMKKNARAEEAMAVEAGENEAPRLA